MIDKKKITFTLNKETDLNNDIIEKDKLINQNTDSNNKKITFTMNEDKKLNENIIEKYQLIDKTISDSDNKTRSDLIDIITDGLEDALNNKQDLLEFDDSAFAALELLGCQCNTASTSSNNPSLTI